MASANSSHKEPPPTEHPKLVNSIGCVLRTSRKKTTAPWEKRRNNILIKSNNEKDCFFHVTLLNLNRYFLKSFINSSLATSAAFFRAMTTQSTLVARRFASTLKTSRISLFTRFLFTALPTRLLTVTPSREKPTPLSKKKKRKSGVAVFRPSWVRTNSALFNKRAAFGKLERVGAVPR